jgi:hypothetical protein
MSPLTGVITEAWALYRAHARHLISVAFVVYLPFAVLSLLVALAGSLIGILLVDLVFFIGFLLLEAALVKAVQDIRDGTTNLSVGQTFQSALPSLGNVLVASIGGGILIFIGFCIFIIPGIWMATIWCLIVPVIVLENVGALASFSRSMELVRGRFWNVLGTLVLVILINVVVEFVIHIILVFFPLAVGSALAVLIAGSIVAPFGAAVITLMYFRLVAAPVGAGGTYGGGPFGGGTGGPYGGPGGPFGGGPYGGQPSGPNDAGFPPPAQPSGGFPPPAQPGQGAPPSS